MKARYKEARGATGRAESSGPPSHLMYARKAAAAVLATSASHLKSFGHLTSENSMARKKRPPESERTKIALLDGGRLQIDQNWKASDKGRVS